MMTIEEFKLALMDVETRDACWIKAIIAVMVCGSIGMLGFNPDFWFTLGFVLGALFGGMGLAKRN
jgi:hypothetical protein